MKINDYILSEDVKHLTDEEFQAYRHYLRLLGYRVSDLFGNRGELDLELYAHAHLYMLRDGDLCWCYDIPKGNRITLEEIRRAIQLVG